jgi:hypothetical protein
MREAIRLAPSRREYSVWRWQWTNSAGIQVCPPEPYGPPTVFSRSDAENLLRLPIDLAAVANLVYDDLATLVAHEVDHPVIALPDPVFVFA